MRKSHFNDEFLVLLGPIISRYFASSNEEKKLNQNNKECVLWSNLYDDFEYKSPQQTKQIFHNKITKLQKIKFR
jgi:hypothetical protein